MMKEKQQYIWNALGTLASTAVSILLLMISSRLLPSVEADLFSISYTIAQQLLIIGIFGVRPYQSTDVHKEHSFQDYFYTRLITIMLMLLVLLVYLVFTGNFSSERTTVLILMTSFRLFDAFSDVFQGHFQQEQRSDLAGKILFYRSVWTVLVFTCALWLTRQLWLATGLILLVNAVLTVSLDKAYYQVLSGTRHQLVFCWSQIKSILLKCSPLFFNAFLINYIFSEPRLVIDRLLQMKLLNSGMQRDFSILFMPTFALNILFLMLRPLLTQLSTYWQDGNKSRFQEILRRVVLVLLGLEGLVLLLGYLLGIPVLGFIFGVDLSSYQLPLMILLVGGGCNLFASLIDNIMVIYRAQQYLILANMLTFLVTKLTTFILISKFGLLGASFSFLLAMAVYLLSSLLIYWLVRRQRRTHECFTNHSSL